MRRVKLTCRYDFLRHGDLLIINKDYLLGVYWPRYCRQPTIGKVITAPSLAQAVNNLTMIPARMGDHNFSRCRCNLRIAYSFINVFIHIG